jgi:hypothetical protein
MLSRTRVYWTGQLIEPARTREGCSSSPPPPCRDFLGTVHLNSQQNFAQRSAYFEKIFLFLGSRRTDGREVSGRCPGLACFAPSGQIVVAPARNLGSMVRISPQAIEAIEMRDKGTAAQRASAPGAPATGVGRAEHACPHGPRGGERLGHPRTIGIVCRGRDRRDPGRHRRPPANVPDLDLIRRVLGSPLAEGGPAEARLGTGAAGAGFAHCVRSAVASGQWSVKTRLPPLTDH